MCAYSDLMAATDFQLEKWDNAVESVHTRKQIREYFRFFQFSIVLLFPDSQ